MVSVMCCGCRRCDWFIQFFEFLGVQNQHVFSVLLCEWVSKRTTVKTTSKYKNVQFKWFSDILTTRGRISAVLNIIWGSPLPHWAVLSSNHRFAPCFSFSFFKRFLCLITSSCSLPPLLPTPPPLPLLLTG